MSTSNPTTLALDFDGVICNGMSEYFATSWETYCKIWQVSDRAIPTRLSDKFAKYRPLIETGWEMPILIRSLVLEVPETEISENWSNVCQDIVRQTNLDAGELAQRVDGYRDEWIARDLNGWLALHEFYPGVVAKLKDVLEGQTNLVIITTKEGRFVRELLKKEGVNIDKENIFGKEQKQPKTTILSQLLQRNPDEVIWFVEDRWQTLQKVAANPELRSVKLYLADWGYNTEAERQLAKIDSRVKLISLTDFARDFQDWH